jgi:hypothetical protein
MPVGEMLRRMDARELAEWRAYFSFKRRQAEEPKKDAATELRRMFGGRVIKKQG